MFTLQTRNSTGVWQTWETYATLGDALRAASVARELWPCGTFRVNHKPT